MSIKKVVFKFIEECSFTYLGIGGIRFYDRLGNIINSGSVITSTLLNGETNNFIISSSSTYNTAYYYPTNAFDSSKSQIGSYSEKVYWLASVKTNQFLSCEFKVALESLGGIQFVPLMEATANRGIDVQFNIEIYDEANILIDSYVINPINVRDGIQSLMTPKLGGRTIKNNIKEMKIGDMIPCKYVSSSKSVGKFSELGSCDYIPIPLNGALNPAGLFYFIHAGYDNQGRMKLIADRNIQHTINWDTLNNSGLVNGVPARFFFEPDLTTSSGLIESTDSYPNTYPSSLFDDNIVKGWATKNGSAGWVSYQFTEPQKIEGYTVRSVSHSKDLLIRAPKNWTFEGWDGTSWIVLDTVTNQIEWGLGEKRFFEFKNKNSYIKYRINITANNGGDLVQFTEIEMMRLDENAEKSINIEMRLLTGGTTSSDTFNEWNKNIIENSLNNTIVAGSNVIWNWHRISSLTSTIDINNSANRVIRGNTNNNTFSTFSSTAANTSMGFRPVLLVNILSSFRYLFQDGNYVKYYNQETNTIEPLCLMEELLKTSFINNGVSNFDWWNSEMMSQFDNSVISILSCKTN